MCRDDIDDPCRTLPIDHFKYLTPIPAQNKNCLKLVFGGEWSPHMCELLSVNISMKLQIP